MGATRKLEQASRPDRECVDRMDAFEELVAEILRADGWWVHRGYKILLSADEKRALNNGNFAFGRSVRRKCRSSAGLR